MSLTGTVSPWEKSRAIVHTYMRVCIQWMKKESPGQVCQGLLDHGFDTDEW